MDSSMEDTETSFWKEFVFQFTAIKLRFYYFAVIKIRLNGKEWKRFPILNPIWYLFKVQYILCWLKLFFKKRFYLCHHHQNQPHLILLLLNRIPNPYLSTEQKPLKEDYQDTESSKSNLISWSSPPSHSSHYQLCPFFPFSILHCCIYPSSWSCVCNFD